MQSVAEREGHSRDTHFLNVRSEFTRARPPLPPELACWLGSDQLFGANLAQYQARPVLLARRSPPKETIVNCPALLAQRHLEQPGHNH